jgi:hypothetical protein
MDQEVYTKKTDAPKDSIDTYVIDNQSQKGRPYGLNLGDLLVDGFVSHLIGAATTGLLTQITDSDTAGVGYYAGAFATFAFIQYKKIRQGLSLEQTVCSFLKAYDKIGGIGAYILIPHLVGAQVVSACFDPSDSGGSMSFTYAGSFLATYAGMAISEKSGKSLRDVVVGSAKPKTS